MKFSYLYLSSNIRNSFIISSNSSLESRLNIGPSSLILVFFLTPCDISIIIFIQFLFYQIKWEWADLFNSGYCNFLVKTCRKLMKNILKNKYFLIYITHIFLHHVEIVIFYTEILMGKSCVVSIFNE